MAEARFLASREARRPTVGSSSNRTALSDVGGVSDVRRREEQQEEGRNDDDNKKAVTKKGAPPRAAAASTSQDDGVDASPKDLPGASSQQQQQAQKTKFKFVKYRAFADAQKKLQQQQTEGRSSEEVGAAAEQASSSTRSTTTRGGNPLSDDVTERKESQQQQHEDRRQVGSILSPNSDGDGENRIIGSSNNSSTDTRHFSSTAAANGCCCRAEHLVSVHAVLMADRGLVASTAPLKMTRAAETSAADNDVVVRADDGTTDTGESSWGTAMLVPLLLPPPIMEDVDPSPPPRGLPSYPAVIRNVAQSVVDVCGSNFPSVHVAQVQHSAIRLWDGVPHGAVHVTNCHHTDFYVYQSIQQVRIHDSTNLNVHLVSKSATVTGGVILENCTSIAFYVDADAADHDDKMKADELCHLDIKDFSFLKRGVPSPNFTVQRRWASDASSSDRPRPFALPIDPSPMRASPSLAAAAAAVPTEPPSASDEVAAAAAAAADAASDESRGGKGDSTNGNSSDSDSDSEI